MTERVVQPSELTVTFIHCSDPNCRECSHVQETWTWLDELVKAGGQNTIPAITLIRDPESNKLLVYDGNIRVAHAAQNGYSLKARIISDQTDFNVEYRDRAREHTRCWFGIEDFRELLKFMRIFAEYPYTIHKDIPPEIRRLVETKAWGWKTQQDREIFGPDDDE